jgi:hypothetical protein
MKLDDEKIQEQEGEEAFHQEQILRGEKDVFDDRRL